MSPVDSNRFRHTSLDHVLPPDSEVTGQAQDEGVCVAHIGQVASIKNRTIFAELQTCPKCNTKKWHVN